MTIAKHHTPTKKQVVALSNSKVGDLLPAHLKEILLQSKEENQEFSPDSAQLSRYLDACGDCV